MCAVSAFSYILQQLWQVVLLVFHFTSVVLDVGFSLRKDDPEQLKKLILDIQQKAASVDTGKFHDE